MPDAGEASAVAKTNVSAATKAPQKAANRYCGPCTACCTVMAVAELDKLNYERCRHDCGYCAIYDSRPNQCREWSCSWLFGQIEGDERRRPDQLGLVFNREPLAGMVVMVAYEVWPRAGREADKEYLLRKMSQKMPVILREYQTRHCDVITSDAAMRQKIRQAVLAEWRQQPDADWSECAYRK